MTTKHKYRIRFLYGPGMGPDIITNTDHNAKSAAKKLLREINRANSPGELVRINEDYTQTTVATFQRAEDL